MSEPTTPIDPTSQNLMQTLGIEFTHLSPQLIEASMPVNEKTCQPMGYLHGGATIALAESIAGMGSMHCCDQSTYAVGTQVSAHHLHSAKLGDTVLAKGVLIHQGKTTHLWQIDVISNKTQQLISTIRITNMILNRYVK